MRSAAGWGRPQAGQYRDESAGSKSPHCQQRALAEKGLCPIEATPDEPSEGNGAEDGGMEKEEKEDKRVAVCSGEREDGRRHGEGGSVCGRVVRAGGDTDCSRLTRADSGIQRLLWLQTRMME